MWCVCVCVCERERESLIKREFLKQQTISVDEDISLLVKFKLDFFAPQIVYDSALSAHMVDSVVAGDLSVTKGWKMQGEAKITEFPVIFSRSISVNRLLRFSLYELLTLSKFEYFFITPKAFACASNYVIIVIVWSTIAIRSSKFQM